MWDLVAGDQGVRGNQAGGAPKQVHQLRLTLVASGALKGRRSHLMTEPPNAHRLIGTAGNGELTVRRDGHGGHPRGVAFKRTAHRRFQFAKVQVVAHARQNVTLLRGAPRPGQSCPGGQGTAAFAARAGGRDRGSRLARLAGTARGAHSGGGRLLCGLGGGTPAGRRRVALNTIQPRGQRGLFPGALWSCLRGDDIAGDRPRPRHAPDPDADGLQAGPHGSGAALKRAAARSARPLWFRGRDGAGVRQRMEPAPHPSAGSRRPGRSRAPCL
jgi:hypothetical protein